MAKKPTDSENADQVAVTKPVRKPRVRKAATGDKDPVAQDKPARPTRARKAVAEPGNGTPQTTAKAPRAKPATKSRNSASEARTTKQAVGRKAKAVTPVAPETSVVPPDLVETVVPSAVPPLPPQSDTVPATAPAIPPDVAPVPTVTPTPAPTPEPEVTPTPAPAHDHELAHGLSPVDLPVPEGGEQPGLGWMAGIIITTSLLLALFNSFAIDKWARALPVSEHSGQIMDAAAAWHGAMDRIDFNLPLETGRSAWHWVKALQWPSSDSAPADGADADAAEAGTGS